MTTDHFCFYLQNRIIQTSQEVNGTVIVPPLVFPGTFNIKVVHNTLGHFSFIEFSYTLKICASLYVSTSVFLIVFLSEFIFVCMSVYLLI
jgi:hypothetical protein